MKIQCRTLFDCTSTGITGHFKPGQIPFVDRAGRQIQDFESWSFSRNQQRNFETIMQMISLRALPTVVEYPTEDAGVWQFVFEVETPGVYSTNNDPHNMDALLQECAGIPMITGLTESSTVDPRLVSTEPEQNIWFTAINI